MHFQFILGFTQPSHSQVKESHSNAFLDLDIVWHLPVPVEESPGDHLRPLSAGVRLDQLQKEDSI